MGDGAKNAPEMNQRSSDSFASFLTVQVITVELEELGEETILVPLSILSSWDPGERICGNMSLRKRQRPTYTENHRTTSPLTINYDPKEEEKCYLLPPDTTIYLTLRTLSFPYISILF